MINIRQYENALKITWIRTFIKDAPDWSEFAYQCQIDRLYQTETNYHNTLMARTKNQFWLSVIKGYNTFYLSIKKEIIKHPELTPLWGNPNIPTTFNVSLFMANIRYLQDLYQGNTRLTIKELEEVSGNKLPFTLYHSLWSAIPTPLKIYMKDKEVTYYLRYPESISVILRDQKGTTSIREIMNKGASNQSTGLLKWTEELAMNSETNWQHIYTIPKKCNVNARIRFFQYQVLHRSLLTNRKLSLFNLIDTEIWDNCDKVETVTHLLLECQQLDNLWRGIEGWIHLNINEKVIFNKRSILLGSPENSTIVNYIF